MSDSNATERLRALLDERGVEYTTCDGKYVKETCWPYLGELMAAFAEFDNGTTRFELDHWCFTPEQAVAATLGSQIDADLRKAIDFMRIWISDDAHLGESEFSYELEKAEGLRKLEAIEQAIAATLGRGECEWQFCKSFQLYDAYQCSNCGQVESLFEGCELPKFCKGCGAKAVKR